MLKLLLLAGICCPPPLSRCVQMVGSWPQSLYDDRNMGGGGGDAAAKYYWINPPHAGNMDCMYNLSMDHTEG